MAGRFIFYYRVRIPCAFCGAHVYNYYRYYLPVLAKSAHDRPVPAYATSNNIPADLCDYYLCFTRYYLHSDWYTLHTVFQKNAPSRHDNIMAGTWYFARRNDTLANRVRLFQLRFFFSSRYREIITNAIFDYARGSRKRYNYLLL